MKKVLVFAAALMGAVCASGMTVCAAEEAYPVTVTDGLGNEITMETAPQSIVSLGPVDTEILFAVGAGELVTGRTDYCNYPEEAQEVDSIGDYSNPNMELILSKSPDLVVASGYIDDTIRQQLEDNEITVYVTTGNDCSLETVKSDIETLGKLVGHEEEALAVVEEMEQEWQELSEKLEAVSEEKTAFVDIGSLYSAGPTSLLDNSLKMIKVKNIAADAESAWPQLSAETVVAADPDVYISLFSPLEDVLLTAGFSDMACLNEDGRFIFIDGSSVEGDMIQRSGPRYVEGLELLAEMIYPELVEE